MSVGSAQAGQWDVVPIANATAKMVLNLATLYSLSCCTPGQNCAPRGCIGHLYPTQSLTTVLFASPASPSSILLSASTVIEKPQSGSKHPGGGSMGLRSTEPPAGIAGVAISNDANGGKLTLVTEPGANVVPRFVTLTTTLF